VGDLYSLNSKVQECNLKFKDMGKHHDEAVFYNFNTTFNKYLPNGDKKKLWDHS
jgi:hypothetical protein